MAKTTEKQEISKTIESLPTFDTASDLIDWMQEMGLQIKDRKQAVQIATGVMAAAGIIGGSIAGYYILQMTWWRLAALIDPAASVVTDAAWMSGHPWTDAVDRFGTPLTPQEMVVVNFAKASLGKEEGAGAFSAWDMSQYPNAGAWASMALFFQNLTGWAGGAAGVW